jgi:hypothetical protein
MEREVPFVVAMAWSFDVLEVVRAFAALDRAWTCGRGKEV